MKTFAVIKRTLSGILREQRLPTAQRTREVSGDQSVGRSSLSPVSRLTDANVSLCSVSKLYKSSTDGEPDRRRRAIGATRSATLNPKAEGGTMRNYRQLVGMAFTMGVLFAMACEESPVTPVDVVPSFGRGGGGGGGGGKPPPSGPAATLDIRDAIGDKVNSDGLGTYTDGEAKAQVAITGGDFHFKARTHRKGTRSVTLTLPAVAGGVQTFDDEFFDFRVHLGLLWIPCGGSGVTTHGRFLLETTEGQAHLAFDVPDLGGDPLSIVRADNGGGTSTWTITSTGDGFLRLDNVHVGDFAFPFEFIVTGEGVCPA